MGIPDSFECVSVAGINTIPRVWLLLYVHVHMHGHGPILKWAMQTFKILIISVSILLCELKKTIYESDL